MAFTMPTTEYVARYVDKALWFLGTQPQDFYTRFRAIRHVITPQVTFSYAPDFGARRYGYYQTYQKTDAQGNVSLVEYSPYSNGMFGVPGKGRTGNIAFCLD